MSTTHINTSPASAKFRAIVILLTLFGASALVTFFLRGTARANVGAPAKQQSTAVASFPRMPADTEEKLANALNPQSITIPSVFFEPFVDRLERVSQSIAPRPQPRVAKPEAEPAPPIPDFVTRYRLWQSKVIDARAARMPAPPVSQVYLLSELEPVGRRNARGQQSALLFVRPEQRVMAVPLGTDFYDATLEGIDERGVIFRTATGLRAIEWSTPSNLPAQSTSGEREKRAQPENQPQRTTPGAMNSIFADTRAATRPRRVTPPAISPTTVSRDQSYVAKVGILKVGILKVLQEAVKNRRASSDSNQQDLRRNGAGTKPRGRASKPQNSYAQTIRLVPEVRVKGIRFYNDKYDQQYADTPSGGDSLNTDDSLNTVNAGYASPAGVQYIRTSAHSPMTMRAVSWSPSQEEKRPRRATLGEDARRDAAPQHPVPDKGRDSRDSARANSPDDVKDRPGVVILLPGAGAAKGNLSSEPQATRARRAVAPDEGNKRSSKEQPLPLTASGVDNGQTSNAPREVAVTAAESDTSTSTRGSFCDPRYQGELYDITITRSIPLIDIVDDLHNKFGINFFVDAEVQKTPIRISVEQAPWTSVLRTILTLNDLDAVCLPGNIIQIASRVKMDKLKDDRDKSAPLIREVFKLRYLQPVTGGRLNLAGQLQGGPGSANIQTLEEAMRRILRAGNDQRGDVTRVPGRSEFIVVGTAEQIAQIRELIERVDKPGYQVVIKALIYTVNDTKVKDIGPQISAIVGNTSQTTLGGLSSFNSSGANGGNGNGGQGGGNGTTGSVGRNPGGIGGLGEGFRQPGGGLQVPDPTAVVGITTIVGTAQFSAQLSLALKKSVANIQARPFGTVENGNQLNLVAGTTIPVVTNTIVAGGVAPTGNVQFIEASRVLRITPQVAEDADGRPNFVTLEIQIENNSIDPSKGTFGSLPVLERQSLQTTLRLKAGETGVIGGLAADSVARAINGIPFLSSVPGLGRIFRRQFDQIDRGKLYFAVTAEVVEQGAALPNPPVPADATTELTPPPPPQKPSPNERKP